MHKILKSNINIFLNSLKGKVYAPITLTDGTISYGLLEDGKLTLENVLPIISPKSVLFPSTEDILHFKSNIPKEIKINHEPIFLFGVRSFDIAAIKYTDQFFCKASDFCDDIYSNRRKNTIIIALANEKSINGSFKTPEHPTYIAEDGFDIQLIEHKDLYYVETNSSKGKTIINNLKNILIQCNEKDKETIKRIKDNADTALKKHPDLIKALSKLCNGRDLDPFWEEMANMCIECGGCSYVCPGCTCFNVYDLVHSDDSGAGQRQRSWDSCIYRGFTKETSGHNHRKEQKERVKRRYTHKLTCDNQIICFGCGRCDLTCPVNLGLKNITTMLAEYDPIFN